MRIKAAFFAVTLTFFILVTFGSGDDVVSSEVGLLVGNGATTSPVAPSGFGVGVVMESGVLLGTTLGVASGELPGVGGKVGAGDGVGATVGTGDGVGLTGLKTSPSIW